MGTWKNSRGVDIDKLIENGKKTQFRGETAAKAQKESTKAYKQNLNLQRIAQKILTATPGASESLKKQLQDSLGIDPNDAELLTTASLIYVKMVQRAMQEGDLATVKTVFEMAGQLTDAKGIADKQRLEIEKERLKLDKERSVEGTSADEPVTIVIRRPEDGD